MDTKLKSQPAPSTPGEESVEDLSPPDEPTNGDGIYVLRTTQQNQIQLNLVADQKANIIIGVSLIFLTLTQAQLANLDPSENRFLAPLLILAVTMLSSFLMAVMVVAPKMMPSKVNQASKLPNPLFFGFFYSVDEEDYTDHLQGLLRENLTSRELLIRDIHQTGCVLRKKYRRLRFAYVFLAAGVLASGISMGVQALVMQ